ncbi:Josephin-domain-containing protein [Fimicolochytrium jonesii]|uniref:Josephin-domain-containing protein n=1 Tax=Fimicolochytrium jonesii TaxID=1396493 RepID=UPI0022FDFD18|nr:Josephin-domain-containing protein [Fimicolochytrium jonesii]KAI8820550.1 Josephin-domain-containing protein [Fimicolochytrium jonesii]
MEQNDIVISDSSRKGGTLLSLEVYTVRRSRRRANIAPIYHERQRLALCGLHALNNALQGQYFTQTTMTAFAQELDAAEASLTGTVPADPSHNWAAQGDFSVQVLDRAVRSLGLQMNRWQHQSGTDPVHDSGAIVVHSRAHWMAFRRINGSWFNLDSLLPQPVSMTNGDLVSGMMPFPPVGQAPHLLLCSRAHTLLNWLLHPPLTTYTLSARVPWPYLLHPLTMLLLLVRLPRVRVPQVPVLLVRVRLVRVVPAEDLAAPLELEDLAGLVEELAAQEDRAVLVEELARITCTATQHNTT